MIKSAADRINGHFRKQCLFDRKKAEAQLGLVLDGMSMIKAGTEPRSVNDSIRDVDDRIKKLEGRLKFLKGRSAEEWQVQRGQEDLRSLLQHEKGNTDRLTQKSKEDHFPNIAGLPREATYAAAGGLGGAGIGALLTWLMAKENPEYLKSMLLGGVMGTGAGLGVGTLSRNEARKLPEFYKNEAGESREKADMIQRYIEASVYPSQVEDPSAQRFLDIEAGEQGL